MILQNQVCALKQAKRLKELRVIQDSFFYWTQTYINLIEEFKVLPIQNCSFFDLEDNEDVTDLLDGDGENEIYAAFTVAELGVMLPKQFGDDRIWDSLPLSNTGIPFSECWLKSNNGYKYFGAFKTEAEARAAMLIYLLENRLTTADEVNARLQAA